MNTYQDPRHTAIPLMAVVYRGFDTSQEVYRLSDLKPMPATQMHAAINAHDELVAALQECVDALTLLCPTGTEQGNYALHHIRAALAKVQA